MGSELSAASGTGAERTLWVQYARRSVGNRKERLRDYVSSPWLRRQRNTAMGECPGE